MKELNKQGNSDPGDMPYRSYLDHPSMDLMERFVLRRSSEEETELVETHMFACESCASVRENLELDIRALKLALQESRTEQTVSGTQPVKAGIWKKWFSLPVLSFAAAGLATCVFCLFAFVPANVELEAQRGTATSVIPEFRNTHLLLRDAALQPGPLQAEVADETGTLMWHGVTSNAAGQVTLNLPRIMHVGHYYARLYAPGAEHELLSEFPFDVKFQF